MISARKARFTNFKGVWEEHKLLLILLAGSWAVRVLLNLQGGQLAAPDEHRYFRSFNLIHNLRQMNLNGALSSVVAHPDHTFFAVIGIIPAGVQHALSKLLGLDPYVDVSPTFWIAASVLSLTSVANIGLVYALARKLDASQQQALMASFLMACANSIFYYSRHFLPYDASMMLALSALWVGIDERPGAIRSFVCGVLSALAFLTYNGYWTTALTVLAIHVLRGQTWKWEVIKRGVASGLGFIAPPALLSVVSIVRGELLLTGMERFSHGASTQGVFSEGWSLPWEYLWHAEHGLLIVWVAGVLTILWLYLKGSKAARTEGLIWLGAAAFIYLLFILGSNVLQRFNVYGRLARQLVPFLCLATACGMFHLSFLNVIRGKIFLRAAMCAILVQAIYNFAQPLSLTFPREVRASVRANYGEVDDDVTIYSNLYYMNDGGEVIVQDRTTQAAARNTERSRYVLLNAGFPWPLEGRKNPPDGRVVFEITHPLRFAPYQYESFVPSERALIRSTDFSMRLIDTADER